MDFAKISIQKPVITWLLVIGAVIGGFLGYQNVGRLEDPAFTIKLAVIVTPYWGATAEQVEREVTDKLEIAIQKLDTVKEVLSRSHAGRSIIEVELHWTADSASVQQSWDELRRKVGDIQPFLPEGAGPSMVDDDFGDVYGILYAVHSDELSSADLHRYAKWLRLQLLQVEDVADAWLAGAIGEEFHVDFSPQQLAAFGLHPGELLNGLRTQNRMVSAGGYRIGERFAQIQPSGLFNDTDDLAKLPVGRAGMDAFLRLEDVAEVSRGYEERPSQVIRHNSSDAILIGISGRPKVNIVEVGERVEARLAELASDRPAGVEITPVYEQHAIVTQAVNGFVLNLFLSVGIVVGVLCVFMGWRSGLVVGAVLFLTVAATIFFMQLLGIEMQRVSLGALLIAMGMLVDNAIVVAEGILVRVQRGKQKLQAASEAIKSTWLPLLGATLVGILAFSGIGLSQDETGEFTITLFIVVAISLLLSWVFAVMVTPLFGYYVLPNQKGDGENRDPYKGFAYALYKRILNLSLRYRIATVASLVALTLASFVGFGFVKQSFFPASETPLFFVNTWMPFGTDIRVTSEVAKKLEAKILADERVDEVTTLVGGGIPRFTLVYFPEQPDSSYAQFLVRVHDSDTIEALSADIVSAAIALQPDLFAKSERIMIGPGGGAKIEARLIGEDSKELRRLGDQVMERFHANPEMRNVRTTWREPHPVFRPQFDVERGMMYGIARDDFAQQLEMLSEGSVMGVFREADELIPIRVRLSGQDRENAADLSQRMLWSSGRNGWVPIESVVSKIDLASEEGFIHRKNRERVLTVEADPIAGLMASEVFADARPLIDAIEMPEGYHLEWGGEWEDSTESETALFKALPLGYIAMFVIVVLLFGKIRQPIIVWSVVPMSVIGMSFGLLSTGVSFGFMSLLGAISLTGMLLKNSIVLVDEIDRRIDGGQARYDALVDSSLSRMRPVVLASFTTILGMSPLIFDVFFVGMAVTIVTGLAFATVLTLIAVPVLYQIFFHIRLDEKVA